MNNVTKARTLTEKQHLALERVIKQDPEAIVKYWDEIYQGPRIFPSQGGYTAAFTISPHGSRTNRHYANSRAEGRTNNKKKQTAENFIANPPEGQLHSAEQILDEEGF